MTEKTSQPPHRSTPPRWFWLLLILIPIIFFLATEPQRDGELSLSAAKGVQLDLFGAGSFSKADGITREILLKTTELQQSMTNRSVDFLTSAPLSAQILREQENCTATSCRYATLYDYENGGTVEAIVDVANFEVLELWRNQNARPTASPYVLDKVVEIANTSEEVSAVFGNIARNKFTR